jgi:hypothetical protein
MDDLSAHPSVARLVNGDARHAPGTEGFAPSGRGSDHAEAVDHMGTPRGYRQVDWGVLENAIRAELDRRGYRRRRMLHKVDNWRWLMRWCGANWGLLAGITATAFIWAI